MINRISIYVAALAALLLAGSCTQYDVAEVLLSRDDVSLTVAGNPVFVYNPDKCQLAYNLEKNEYRALDDDGTKYFVIRADQNLSSLGQELTAELRYTVSGKEKVEKDLVFKIEKISNAEGLVWLWCSSKNIGAVIRVF